MILTFHDRHLVFINSDADITEGVSAGKCIFRLPLKATEASVVTFKLRPRYAKAAGLVLMHPCRGLAGRYHI